ncbi:IQ domain-containing protein IQM1-like [Gossypium australe]|uniref:IQ domain-containing protein IQM1-like n=1 Tax=Gossypium australe TaxID=47621 RepID=A0A5B6X8U1_9ROSI|nr:IQ domain-containing protein IQM1-like [Gossypium australe]
MLGCTVSISKRGLLLKIHRPLIYTIDPPHNSTFSFEFAAKASVLKLTTFTYIRNSSRNPPPFSPKESRLMLSIALKVADVEKDRLVNLPGFHLDVLKPLNYLPFKQKSFSFCIPRDRWDKEFFKLQGG